jgi:1,4-dihydroxy-2-naphthoate octaprenyltransferase
VNHTFAAIFGPMRLPFLILAPACVVLGAATAAWTGSEINMFHLVLCLVGAVSAHISVNALNEYSDFNSGLDFNTEPTPFSGGSGTLPEIPEKGHFALITGIVTLIVTVAVGIFFLYIIGLGLLPLGVLGLIIVVVYTDWLTRNPFLCLIAPGLGFGPLMVMGSDFVLSGAYSATAFVASLVPFFLVSDLLLLNQFPDVEADEGVGRRHLPIVIGIEASVKVYISFLWAAYTAIILGCLSGMLPLHGLLALVTIALAIPTMKGVSRYAGDIPNLIPHMGKNVIIIILTPVLLAIGLFVAS